MDKDLEWLARNLNEWPREPKINSHSVGWNGLNDGRLPDFIRRLDPSSAEYTKNQWQDARRILGLDAPATPADNVNHPKHYQSDNGIECIDAIRAALGLSGFVSHCRGTAIKYCWRSGKKQEHAEDLRKAAWYLLRAAEALEE